MSKRFLIGVQSYSDIITNSSSELFLVDADKVGKTAVELEKLLEEKEREFQERCGGMGGIIEVTPYSVDDQIYEYIGDAVGALLNKYDITVDEVKELVDCSKLRERMIENRKKEGIAEKSYCIDVDECYKKLINYIKNELGGVEF